MGDGMAKHAETNRRPRFFHAPLPKIGIAHEFGGICNIRMDDTNPTKEETEYVDSIMADVRWLIGGWADKNLGGAPLYTSDYFDKHYEFAVELVRKGKAYVDEMPA